MRGQFDPELTLPDDPTKRVTISGPLQEVDPKDTEAAVLFLIVQGEGRNALTVQGTGRWRRGSSSNDPPWSGTVKREGKTVVGRPKKLKTGKARGIGLAIVVKPGNLDESGEFVPPSIEALTWCADFKFVRES
jgi:hypothetical protein